MLWSLFGICVPPVARAQEVAIYYPPPSAPAKTPGLGRRIGLGVAGAVAAFLAHEGGHLFANLLLGNKPYIQGIMVGGVVPFFVVNPGIRCMGDVCRDRHHDRFGPGRAGTYFIVTAGFHVQHITDELLLTRNPNLRYQYAPVRKGMLLFNVFLSCFYAAGAFTGLEDSHGDLAGAARVGHVHEAWLATLLLMPAALDTYRYFVPGVRWAPWASRGAKLALFGLTFAF